ncbi:MAG: hypothetical protein HY287_02380 [Planctomycetes bacterium]|nr:hypothetical protein [Planctomycetota bacterium]MBI3833156.1 hypothetical protein [Planctomycetota bacterium]
MSSRDRADLALRKLGLDPDEGFGQSYFTSLYRMLLEHAFDASPECNSFTELRNALAGSGWRDFRSGDDAVLLAKVDEAAEEDARQSG